MMTTAQGEKDGMNKHKHIKTDCVHIQEFRQLYQHEGYDQAAEYCPKTYICEIKNLPMCKNCKEYKKAKKE